MNSFENRLKQAMNERNMNQAELSALTGFGKSKISNWINGKNEPRKEALVKLADALGCSIDFLIPAICEVSTPVISEERKLTLAEAAKRCGKNKDDLGDWIQSGECPFGRAFKGKGTKYHYLIPPKRLEKWLAGEI